MKTSAKHTPTPWEVKGNLNKIENAKGLTVCDLRSNTVDADADAEFIVRAVNSHEELLAVVRNLVTCMDAEPDGFHVAFIAQAKKAIAKAEGK